MEEQKQGVRWDLTSYFPKFNCPEMIQFKKKLWQDVKLLQKKAAKAGALTSKTAPLWEQILLKAEEFVTRLGHIDAYIGCLTSTYADNEDYISEEGELLRLGAEFEKFGVDVQQAFKNVKKDVFEKFICRDGLKDVKHSLRRRREEAIKTMTPVEEKLTAELNIDGYHSWGRLYDNITGKLEFDMVYPDGRCERKPISQWRPLMADPNREIGKAAFEGGNKAWQSIETVCGAALNAIAGTRLTLYKRRGIKHFLDKALFHASIKQKTLDAMYKGIYDNIEIAREIFRAKSAYMGRKGIWWFEREAPLPLKDATQFGWDECTRIIGNAFNKVYPGFANYYESALKKRWVESESRPNKRPGAFCTGSLLTKEQRVYMTFTGALGGLTTLAHEMGHAFHGHIMRDLRPMAHEVPMTLAETASIFGEQALAEGIYSDDKMSDGVKLLILDSELTDAAVMLLDITVRFEFEKSFYEERAKGEVSVSRLKELMVQAQRKVFGDVLLPGSEDPYFWASKLHFYITSISFYNFPYTFGFLFSRELYARFKKEGASFIPKYEQLLKDSGSDAVERIVKKALGADVSSPKFWSESIRSLEEPLALYKRLLKEAK